MSLLFGILFISVTPPLQVPDEPNHFYRAWQISEGTFNSVKENDRVGGNLPKALKVFSDFFYGLTWYGPSYHYNELQVHELFDNKEVENDRVFLDFNNTALYSPICYLPSTAGIFILKQFHWPVLFIFYGARLCSLLFWVFVVYLSIKQIPVFKWLFCFLALFPMSVFINSSISADVVTNGVCFLFISTVLRFVYTPEPVSNKQFIYLLFLLLLLESAKILYSPLAILLLLISKGKFGSIRVYYFKMAGLLIFALIVALYYRNAIGDLYITYNTYNPAFRSMGAFFPGADVQEQINFMKTQEWYGLSVVFGSIINTFPAYFYEFTGVFGWLNVPLPHWLSWILFSFLFFVASADNSDTISLKIIHRLVFIAIFYLILCLIFLSQYLSWNPIGSPEIAGIQGRYLIPFCSLLLFPFYKLLPPNKYLIGVLVIAGSVFSLVFSLITLHQRYFS